MSGLLKLFVFFLLVRLPASTPCLLISFNVVKNLGLLAMLN